MLATDDARIQQQRQTSFEQLDDIKAEHEKIEEGGQPPRQMLTTASEQDPEVAPDIQIRAISRLHRGHTTFSLEIHSLFDIDYQLLQSRLACSGFPSSLQSPSSMLSRATPPQHWENPVKEHGSTMPSISLL